MCLCGIAGAGKCSAELAPQLQAALLGLIGKPVHEFVHVDVGEKLAELGLDKFFPVEARATPPPAPPPPPPLCPHVCVCFPRVRVGFHVPVAGMATTERCARVGFEAEKSCQAW